MKDNKTRLCVNIPTSLYTMLNEDALKYGISKSGIISMLLVDYYKKALETASDH